jgi:hypothetical protein
VHGLHPTEVRRIPRPARGFFLNTPELHSDDDVKKKFVEMLDEAVRTVRAEGGWKPIHH